MQYSHVLAAVGSVPWLVHRPTMKAIVEVIERRTSGVRLSDAEIAERIAAADRRAGPRRGAGRAGRIAVIPVYGIMAHRAEFFADTSSSGTSVQSVQRAFREATKDDSVDAILFDVDSPGGQAAGIPELAAEIRAARGTKPMVTVSNTFMASAAYWPFAQADEIIVTPSSLTGSIGVVMAHVDETGLNEKLGVKVTLVYAGEHKVETYPESSLTDDAVAYLQSLVDDLHGQFLQGVADARGIAAERVRADFGQGRVLTATEAVKVGMADLVGTYEDAIARLAEGKVKMRGARAAGDLPARFAELVAERERLIAAGADPITLDIPIEPAAAAQDITVSVGAGGARDAAEDLDEIALEQAIAARRRR